MADGTPDVGKSAAAEARKLKVFISYSRDDLDFADQLVAALELCGFEPTIDRHGISGGEAWQQRLGALLLEADTVVFVLSPASARSSICNWEVTEAARLSKRILPVLARALDGASPPQLLQDLNYVHFYPEPRAPGSGFGVGLAALVASLNTDLDWIREHTRLLERATEWAARGRSVSRLLSGSDIADAKKWVNERPKGAPEPTARHLEFIRASEDQETLRASSERQRLEEMAAAQEERAKALRAAEDAVRKEGEAQAARRRAQAIITWGSAGAAIVLLVVAGLAVLQWREAERQRVEAERQRIEAQTYLRETQITESRALVGKAQQLAHAGDHTTGILLSLEALPDPAQKLERPLVTEARGSLSAGLGSLRERFVFEAPAVLSPDGRRVLTMPDKSAPRVWDAATGQEIMVLGPADQSASRGSFSPDGTLIITQLHGKAPRLWPSTGKEPFVLGGAEEEVIEFAISPNSKRVVTRSRDLAPQLWDTATGQKLFALDSAGPLDKVSFSPDSQAVLTESSDTGLRLWDVASGQPLLLLGDPDEGARPGLFSPDGKLVLTRPKGRGPRLWDARTAKVPVVLDDVDAREAHFSPNGELVLTVSGERAPRLWRTSTGEQLFAFGNHNTAGRTAAFSLDSKLLLTVSWGSEAKLWDTATGNERAILSEGDKKIAHAFFSPNGKHLVTTSDSASGTMRLWSIPSGREHFTFAAIEHKAEVVMFSPDGTVALTAPSLGSATTAHLWDLAVRDHDARPAQRERGQDIIERAKAVVPRCLTIDQRKILLLRPHPPRWCIDKAMYPFGDANVWNTEGAVDIRTAEQFGNFADAAVKAGDFPKGLEAADLGIRFGPDLLWIRVNRAHALMFLERLDEARSEYLAHRGKDVPDHGLWESVVLREFAELRENSREHPLMAEIEALFQAPSASQ